MGTIEFLGIAFRSAQHLEWFVFTLITFGANICFIAVCWASGKRFKAPCAFCGVLGGLIVFLLDSGGNNNGLRRGQRPGLVG